MADAAPDCRINALPDDLLCRAISGLNARELVQTCVVSRRWCHLWRSVPRINATYHEFDDMAATDDDRDVLFKKFINRFLLLRNPVSLDEFRLRYHLPDGSHPRADSREANLWILHALRSDVRSLVVSAMDIDLRLNPSVFASNCSLTSLHLCTVFVEPPFFKSLRTGCPALQRLVFIGCIIYDPDISSHSLKVLTIDHECTCTFDGRASISIPSLTHIHFAPTQGIMPLLNNRDSLVSASFRVDTSESEVEDECQFLRCLSNVANLDFFCTWSMLKMETLLCCPKFNDLTTLRLGEWCLFSDFYALIVFLQNSPNLMKLTLVIQEVQLSDWSTGDLEERSFTCEHLMTVEIVCWSLRVAEDDPLLTGVVELLRDNGIMPTIRFEDNPVPLTSEDQSAGR